MTDPAEETERVLTLLEGASGSLMCPTEYAMVAVREARRLQTVNAHMREAHREEIHDMQRDHRAEIADLHHDHAREMGEAGAELRAMEREVERAEAQNDRYL